MCKRKEKDRFGGLCGCLNAKEEEQSKMHRTLNREEAAKKDYDFGRKT